VKLPRRIVALLVLPALLVVAATAGAAPSHKPLKMIHPPANVKVGRVAFAQTPWGQPALLVAVRYPIQAGGRVLRIGVRVAGGPGTTPLAQVVSDRVSSGPLRLADRRRTFTFVHEIDLRPRLARRVAAARKKGHSPTVTVEAQGGIDIDGDGKPDIRSKGIPRRTLRLPLRTISAAASATTVGGSKPFCASVPVVTVAPGTRAQIPLPACTARVHWGFVSQPSTGGVILTGKHLAFTAPSQPGTESIRLNHATAVVKVARPWGPTALVGATPNAGPVVRAMGDSVTAGFGYYSDGSLMSLLSLYECKPVGTVLDDACSSNSTATKNGLKEAPYAPDYGLSNNVSWAAQWANKYGVTNYKNYAVSGSEPTNWAPGGSLYSTTQKIESEDPDYILMTIGANPILANTLFGLGPMSCALESDIFGGYEECVEEAFESVHLRAELKSLYTDLVKKTSATIYLMQYHLSIPSSALSYSVTQIAEMGKMMNETIAEVAKEVSPTHLQVVAPPHFNVGVSLEPVYPAGYSCSSFGFTVDGPSVQSTPTQDELEALHYASFCEGPASGGPPWVISGDTGIHPSATGYAQMASQVPAP
jgi:lysophospholipase L1-like esterase